MRFLYYHERCGRGVYRSKVTRETDFYIWISIGKSEIKISKKTYRRGSGYGSTYYYEETPELKAKCEETALKRKFSNTIEKLESIEDVEIIKKLLDEIGRIIK